MIIIFFSLTKFCYFYTFILFFISFYPYLIFIYYLNLHYLNPSLIFLFLFFFNKYLFKILKKKKKKKYEIK